MPHVVVKMLAGRTVEQKQRLAVEVTKAVMIALGAAESSISVAIEDINASDWADKVYTPEILGNQARIFKKPGYRPF